MRKLLTHTVGIVLAGCFMSACGITVPDIREVWDADKPAEAEPPTPTKVPATAQIEWEIKKRVYCDLKEAVQYVNYNLPFKEGLPGRLTITRPSIPLDWGAQVSLSLQVDEASGLNPGVTLNEVLPNKVHVFGPGTGGTVTTPQSFGLGFGGTLSSTATRIDKYNPYYTIAYLMQPDNPRTSICIPGNDPLIGHGWTAASSSPFILESELGIKDWLLGAMEVDNALPSVRPPPQLHAPGGGGGAGAIRVKSGGSGSAGGGGADLTKDAVSYEIKFVIVSSGSITPTWKLVRVSANTGSLPFFNTQHLRGKNSSVRCV
jgi:hypothetical protein